MNRLETHTNPLRLFLFVGKDEGAMQRNEMLFCKGRMGDKKNHFLSFGRMQPTSCTKGTKDLAVPNNSSPCYCHIAAYLTNVFVKPNEQCRACSNVVMARKRTFRGTQKNVFVKPNKQCRACSNIVMARKRILRGTKNNIFLFGRARDQPPPLVRPKQSLAFMPFLAW